MKITFMVKTESDDHNTASGIGSINYNGKLSGVAIAKKLDGIWGSETLKGIIENGEAELVHKSDGEIATGHGVLVTYKSGKSRMVRR